MLLVRKLLARKLSLDRQFDMFANGFIVDGLELKFNQPDHVEWIYYAIQKYAELIFWRPASDLINPCKHMPTTAQKPPERLQVDADVELGPIKCYMSCSISRTVGLHRVLAEEFANEQHSSSQTRIFLENCLFQLFCGKKTFFYFHY